MGSSESWWNSEQDMFLKNFCSDFFCVSENNWKMKGGSAIFLCILVKLPIFFNFLYFSKQIQFESILNLIQHITNDLHPEKFAIRLDLMKIKKELLIMPILFDRSKRTHCSRRGLLNSVSKFGRTANQPTANTQHRTDPLIGAGAPHYPKIAVARWISEVW